MKRHDNSSFPRVKELIDYDTEQWAK